MTEKTSANARPTGLSVPKLRAAVAGDVIIPGDDGYDRARMIFPGGIDRRPAVIVRAATDADVSRVVLLARETGLPISVRSGGHSIHGVVDDGIVLDLSARREVHIDAEQRTAWAETGLTAGVLTAAAAEHGLAVGFGDTGSVGIGGITLGGGVGYLSRKHGLTIDNLLAADVVSADGELLRVDAHSHPDLFWAIRGGGGNFGVATRFQFRLHEVRTVFGGMLLLPATADVIAGFMAAAEDAPDELSTIANVMSAPPLPFVPEEFHGKLVVMAMLVYAGEVDAAERAIAPFRALATPIADMIRPMPYPEIYPPDQDDYHPVAASRTMYADTIDLGKATAILERLEASTAMMAVTQLRVLGGAMARVPAADTAYAHRARRVMINVAAVYQEPEQAAAHEAWVADLSGVLQDGDGAYINFLNADGESRIREAYPGDTWDRLQAIKRRYDPTNLFRCNGNIPPG